jgi:hypothetical protein
MYQISASVVADDIMVMIVFCLMRGEYVPHRVAMLPKVEQGPSPAVHAEEEHVRLLSEAHADTFAGSTNHVACCQLAGNTKGPV